MRISLAHKKHDVQRFTVYENILDIMVLENLH